MWRTLCQNCSVSSQVSTQSFGFHPGDSPPKGFLFFSILRLLASDLPPLSAFHFIWRPLSNCATDGSKNFSTDFIETTSAKFSWFSSVKRSTGTTSPSTHLEAGSFNFSHLSDRVPPPTLCSQEATGLAWYSRHCIALYAHSCFWHLIYPPLFFPHLYFYILFNFSFQF